MSSPAGPALLGIALALASGCATAPAPTTARGIEGFRSSPTAGRHYRLSFVTRVHETLTREESVDVDVVGVEPWGEGKQTVRVRLLWPAGERGRPEIVSSSLVDERWRWDKVLENDSATGLQVPMHDVVESLRAWLRLLGQGLPSTGTEWSSCPRADRCLRWRAVALGGRRWHLTATSLAAPDDRRLADMTLEADMILREGDALPCAATFDHVWMWRGRPVTSKTIRLECVE